MWWAIKTVLDSPKPWARPVCSFGASSGRKDGRNRARLMDSVAGWSSLVARWAHNPKVVGSNPAPATKVLNVIDVDVIDANGTDVNGTDVNAARCCSFKLTKPATRGLLHF